MSERALRTILVGLGALVGLWLVAILVSGPATDEAGGGGELASVLEALDVAQVSGVRFSAGPDPASAVRLQRTDAGWSVDGHPADSLQVARLLEALDQATASGPVATNPANHPRMGIDDSSATTLALEQGDLADTLLLGNAGTSSGSIYARLPGRDDVYVVDADLEPHATREPEAWRSRRIASVDTASVTAVELTVANESLRIERADSSWTVDGGGADADGQAVRDLLSEVGRLEASRFPPPDSVDVVTGGAPDRVVTVLGEQSSVLLMVQLWDPPDDTAGTNVAGRAEGPGAAQAGVTFEVPSWRADRLAPSADHLRGEP
jgi:hypothetical protein